MVIGTTPVVVCVGVKVVLCFKMLVILLRISVIFEERFGEFVKKKIRME